MINDMNDVHNFENDMNDVHNFENGMNDVDNFENDMNDVDNFENENIKNKPIYVIHKPTYGILYTITHFIISLFAIYLSFKCNNGFKLSSFLVALFCPYIYIIYEIAVNSGCGVFTHKL